MGSVECPDPLAFRDMCQMKTELLPRFLKNFFTFFAWITNQCLNLMACVLTHSHSSKSHEHKGAGMQTHSHMHTLCIVYVTSADQGGHTQSYLFLIDNCLFKKWREMSGEERHRRKSKRMLLLSFSLSHHSLCSLSLSLSLLPLSLSSLSASHLN